MFMYQDINAMINRLSNDYETLKRRYYRTKDSTKREVIIQQLLNIEEEIRDLLCNGCR